MGTFIKLKIKLFGMGSFFTRGNFSWEVGEIVPGHRRIGYSPLLLMGRFVVFFTVDFLLVLAPAGGSNPARPI